MDCIDCCTLSKLSTQAERPPLAATLSFSLPQAFNLLSIIIERLADGVAPFADGLLSLLPQVWRRGEGQSLLRAQARVMI